MANHADSPRLSHERIEQAARVIDPVFLNTPQFVCEALVEPLRARLTVYVSANANPQNPRRVARHLKR